MTSANGKPHNGTAAAEAVDAWAEVVGAERIARAIVFTFDSCELNGVPLSQAQKIALIEAALLEFDGFEAELDRFVKVRQLIHESFGR